MPGRREKRHGGREREVCVEGSEGARFRVSGLVRSCFAKRGERGSSEIDDGRLTVQIGGQIACGSVGKEGVRRTHRQMNTRRKAWASDVTILCAATRQNTSGLRGHGCCFREIVAQMRICVSRELERRKVRYAIDDIDSNTSALTSRILLVARAPWELAG